MRPETAQTSTCMRVSLLFWVLRGLLASSRDMLMF
jgi:hypothetical protein